ncbi:tetratricopeptide repeat protein [Luteolibacter sp. SL250]|uniref:tetratricopeptide repeat protein n=1 Tax=Luteolibacter sp. SL250 TaxID=2995170 RepID=UPI00226E6952|nr:tetratricopeptide repeat protein [Luteolibacter sp. SL250]WAC18612.1 tetratricopeptide repeat protein [Luteolibacter sp. SL250]
MVPDPTLIGKLDEADKSGHLALVRYLCEQILANNPEHSPTLLTYARCLVDLSLYDRCSMVLTKLEKVIPEKVRHLVHAERGHLLRKIGDNEGAEEKYLEAHTLDPDDASYLIYAGAAAMRRGDFPRAEAFLKQAIGCSEGCIDEAYFNLGGCHLAQRRIHEARGCYLKALEIDPAYKVARERLEDLDLLIALQQESSA